MEEVREQAMGSFGKNKPRPFLDEGTAMKGAEVGTWATYLKNLRKPVGPYRMSKKERKKWPHAAGRSNEKRPRN